MPAKLKVGVRVGGIRGTQAQSKIQYLALCECIDETNLFVDIARYMNMYFILANILGMGSNDGLGHGHRLTERTLGWV